MPKGIPKGVTSKSVKSLNSKRTCNPINSLSGDIIRAKQLQKWETKQLSTQVYPNTMTNSSQFAVGLNYRPKASKASIKKLPGVKTSQKKATATKQTRAKSLKANSLSGIMKRNASSSSTSKRTPSTKSSSSSSSSYSGSSPTTNSVQSSSHRDSGSIGMTGCVE